MVYVSVYSLTRLLCEFSQCINANELTPTYITQNFVFIQTLKKTFKHLFSKSTELLRLKKKAFYSRGFIFNTHFKPSKFVINAISFQSNLISNIGLKLCFSLLHFSSHELLPLTYIKRNIFTLFSYGYVNW